MSDFNNSFIRTLEKSKSILYFSIDKEMIIKSYNQKFRTLYKLPDCANNTESTSLTELIDSVENSVLIENVQQYQLSEEIPTQLLLNCQNQSFELEINKFEASTNGDSIWMIIGYEIEKLKVLESSGLGFSHNDSALFDLAGDGIILGDHEAKIVKANKKAYELTGYHASELIGQHISFLFNQKHLVKNPLMFQKVNNGEDVKKERLINRKNQEALNVELVSNKTNYGYITIMRDIQERRNAEIALKELKNRLLFVTQMEKIGIIDIDSSNLYANFNTEINAILEKPNEEKRRLEDWFSLIHPEDTSRIKNGLKQVRETGEVFEFFYRLTSEEGKLKTIKASANLSNFNTDNNNNNIIVSSIDITNSNWIKLRLEESEQTFKALTNSATAAIFIYNQKYIYTNQSFEKITGYTFAEVKDKSFWFLISPDHIELVRERGLNRLNNESPSDGYEFKIITKSGIEKWLEFAASPINYMGNPAAIGSAFDITERI